MSKQDIIDYLEECGVCKVCQLRYLKARGNEYANMKETFSRANVKYETSNENDSYYEPGNRVLKKKRRNTCSLCLGLFSLEFQDEMLRSILDTDFSKYECKQVVIAISLPMLLQLRQISMWYALMERFGENIIDPERSPDVPLKEAIKLILNPVICEKLNKEYDAAGIMINMQLTHDQEAEEMDTCRKVYELVFPSKNGKPKIITRGVLEKYFIPTQLTRAQFKQFVATPPNLPSSNIRLETVSLTGPTVYVAGRYRKLSRRLSHTPWILNGKRVMEDSIEEIIIRGVAPLFCKEQKRVNFMSSGREDVDVRCLGKGRPFVLEIPNSFRNTLSKADALQSELEIEKLSLVSVRNLQMVQRQELVHIKMGEEKKRKCYRALCVLQEPVTLDILRKLQIPQGFEIQQKTPIRVLHRRPLHTRARTIYSVKAWVQMGTPRSLVVDVVSQAGTYIKELVHGEFGRTSPCLATIIGQPIDIIALDVIGIDLEWPSYIDNSD